MSTQVLLDRSDQTIARVAGFRQQSWPIRDTSPSSVGVNYKNCDLGEPGAKEDRVGPP